MGSSQPRRLQRSSVAVVVVVVLMLSPARAVAVSQIAGSEAFLQGVYTEVGIRANGTLGSTAAAPVGYHPRVDGLASDGVGLVIDRDKDGWGTGTDDGDFFLPGVPFEGWGFQIGGATYVNNDTTTDITGSFGGLVTTGDQTVTWTADASVGGVLVEQDFTVPRTSQVVHMDVTMTNTTASTLTGVHFWRGADPDNNQSVSGTFATTQTIDSQFAGTGLASVSATQADGSRIELRATDSRAVVAYQDGTFHTAPADMSAIHAGTDPDYVVTTGSSSTVNSPFDLVVGIGSLSPGTAVTFRMSYFLSEGSDSDLTTTISDPSPVTPGTDAVVTVGVANAGPDDAENTSVVYTPPTSTTIDVGSLPAGCTGGSTGPITCAVGTLTVGASTTFDIRLPIDSDAVPATAYSGGSADATTTSVDAGGASSTQADLVVGDRLADLDLGASGPGSLTPGTSGDVTFTVDNAGPSDAPGVNVSYTPPTGITVDTGSMPAGCAGPAAGPVDCSVATVAAGGSQVVVVPVMAPADAIPGTTHTGATASAATSDATDADGATTTPPDITILTRQADLALVAADPGPVPPGASTTVDVTVTNAGPSDAPTTVVDYAPPAFVSVDVGSLPAGCTGSAAAVSCTLGTVAASAAAMVSIPVVLDPAAFANTTLVGADVDATSTATDPDDSDNLDQTANVTTGDVESDISVTVTPPAPVVPGATGVVTVDVTNDGPSDADDPVDLTVTVPSNTTFGTPPSGCVAGATPADPVTCTSGVLAAGDSEQFLIPVAVDSSAAGGATLAGGTASVVNPDDPNSANDTAAVTVDTDAREADLTSTVADPGPIVPGESTLVMVSVGNAGPSDADSVVVVYTPPSDATVDMASIPSGCVADAPTVGSVTCTTASLAASNTWVIGIPVDVAPSAAPSSVLSVGGAVAATSDETDPDGDSGSADLTTAAASADLAISVVDEPLLDPGESGVLQLAVTNLGPSDATGADITYDLPSGVTFDASGSNPLGCAESGGIVTCPIPASSAASVTSVDIPIAIEASVTATFIADGDASITAQATADPDSSNDGVAAAPQLDLTGDSDGDGLTDGDEIDPEMTGSPIDSDGDGLPDYLDIDADNDGVPDAAESGGDPTLDTDGDGIVDHLDLDADGDSIHDVVEGGNGELDADGDGRIDDVAANDGEPDGLDDRAATAVIDSDTDGTPDRVDDDSDDDGIDDIDEAGDSGEIPVDTDGDGTPDYLDTDSDGDGISDADEAGDPAPVDTDGDGTPDFRDLDTDGDGIDDATEGTADDDGDGDPNWRDPEGWVVSGQVYHDANRNVAREGTEPDISGVSVELRAAGSDGEIGTDDDVVVQTAVTASPYTFTNVADGDYLISIVAASLPDGAGSTGDADGDVVDEIAVTVAGADVDGRDFGVATAALTGTVEDADGAPVAGATVTLTDADGNVFTATTGSDGTYTMESTLDSPLMPGTASVVVVVPGGSDVSAAPLMVAAEVTRLDIIAAIDEVEEPVVDDTPALPQTGLDTDTLGIGAMTLLLAGGWVVGATRWLED